MFLNKIIVAFNQKRILCREFYLVYISYFGSEIFHLFDFIIHIYVSNNTS